MIKNKKLIALIIPVTMLFNACTSNDDSDAFFKTANSDSLYVENPDSLAVQDSDSIAVIIDSVSVDSVFVVVKDSVTTDTLSRKLKFDTNAFFKKHKKVISK